MKHEGVETCGGGGCAFPALGKEQKLRGNYSTIRQNRCFTGVDLALLALKRNA